MSTVPLPPSASPTSVAGVFAPDAVAASLALQLRDARPGDLPALLGLEAQFPGDRTSDALFRALIASPRATVRVAELDGRVVGYHVVRRRWFRRTAWLYSIAVDAGARRRGIGRRLLADAEAGARRAGARGMTLEVRADNAAAAALYARAGYRPVKRLRAYYDDGTDGWRHRRDFATP